MTARNGRTLSMTVNGTAVAIVPGNTYTGAIEISE